MSGILITMLQELNKASIPYLETALLANVPFDIGTHSSNLVARASPGAEDRCRTETDINNEVLRVIVEQITGNIVRKYVEEFSVNSTMISRRLKRFSK
ncbi:hypothetical protein TNCV_651891 [Trichonephila clavipes]|nr:hypothetical protein TNCV_651891 [Trichonephila clavipes]